MSYPAPLALDWQPDLPDLRDYHVGKKRIRKLLEGVNYRGRVETIAHIDLRTFFRSSPTVQPGASVAQASVSLVEYFEWRTCGRERVGSVPFVNHLARDIQMGAAVGIRATLCALVRFGVPPARFWPDGIGVPPSVLYGYADRMRDASYVRLDAPKASGEKALRRVRGFLAGGLPCVLGFVVPSSLSAGPDIPMPTKFDAILGGQVAVVVGYDDRRRFRSSHGALRIQPHWGPLWGEAGGGWLPYDYVRRRLAADIWALLHPRWLRSGEVGRAN